jgi:hypothetical protein
MDHMHRVLASAAAAAVLLGAAPAQAKVFIAPHRAVYDLTLKRASERAGLAGVDGRLAFEIAGSTCEGWTVNFRMAAEYRPREGKVRLIDTQSASWESGDGLAMRYNQREYVDGTLETEKKVEAKLSARGGPGQGRVEKPKEEEFALAAGTIFGVEHQLHILDIAQAGGTRDSSLVFDGTDGGKSTRAISFIGQRREAGQSGVDMPTAAQSWLGRFASWPVTISYFSAESGEDAGGEAVPTYQLSLSMFENGVAGNLVLDYGEYVLDGKLAALEEIEQAPCP